MTNEEAKNILISGYEDIVEKSGRGGGKTFATAMLMGARAITLFEQYKWERDVALEQLEELGLNLGQKIEGVYLSEEEYERLLEYKRMYEDLCR